MEGKILFQGTSKNGTSFVIRYPTTEDAQGMCAYINALSQEQTYISFQGETISLEDEQRFLLSSLEKMKKQQVVLLLAMHEKEVIGIASIQLKERITNHEGVFAISLAKHYRGQGIGKQLMSCVLEETEKNMPALRIITLGVFGNNPLAKNMYEQFGFIEYGRIPEGVFYKGMYVDHIFMYKKIR